MISPFNPSAKKNLSLVFLICADLQILTAGERHDNIHIFVDILKFGSLLSWNLYKALYAYLYSALWDNP